MPATLLKKRPWHKRFPVNFAKFLLFYRTPLDISLMKMTIMMMMINCFCGVVDRRNAFSLISSRDHCQRSSPSPIPNTL